MAEEALKVKKGGFAVWIGAAAALAAAAALYGLFALSSKPPANGSYARFATGAIAKLQVKTPAPEQPTQAFTDAGGRAMSLADFRGEVVLLNVWATWCGPCVTELPALAGLQRRFEGRLKVVPVSVDSEGKRADAQAMLAERGGGALGFYIDPTRGMAFAVSSPGLPTTILYDREGRELARLAGGADWDSPEAAALIEAALAS
ncbi:MAG: TlpA family protein disulfide reductase [Hyphomonadaceae bacterium]|nr:TlpA family protein disulfide reductase [Hyphomonadaceae bacterium]